MKKLINGIIKFRQERRPGYQETFARLALGQKPDALFIACSDSRVAVNVFASTDPGDVFVVRNVGNMIPPCGQSGFSESDESEGAAIEFAIQSLGVGDIVVCGHSECGAMRAICEGMGEVTAPHLSKWLRHGGQAHDRLQGFKNRKNKDLADHNLLSQLNVLLQIEHLMSYPVVRQRMAEGKLRLHAWWFNISTADVYAYRQDLSRFVLMDEEEASRSLDQLSAGIILPS